MAQMPNPVGWDVTEHNGESVETDALKNILMRHHQPTEKQKLL